MKKILPILALTLLSISFKAHALGGNSSAKEWTRASSTEQYEYAKKVAEVVNQRTGRQTVNAQEVVSCMREVLNPPYEPYMAHITVGEVASGCVQLLL